MTGLVKLGGGGDDDVVVLAAVNVGVKSRNLRFRGFGPCKGRPGHLKSAPRFGGGSLRPLGSGRWGGPLRSGGGLSATRRFPGSLKRPPG